MPDVVVRSGLSTQRANGAVRIHKEVHTEVSRPRFEVDAPHSRISESEDRETEDNKAPSLFIQVE